MVDAVVAFSAISLGPKELSAGVIFDQECVVVVGGGFEEMLPVVAFVDVNFPLEGAAKVCISGRIHDDGVAGVEGFPIAKGGGIGEGEKSARFEQVDGVHDWGGQHSGGAGNLRFCTPEAFVLCCCRAQDRPAFASGGA